MAVAELDYSAAFVGPGQGGQDLLMGMQLAEKSKLQVVHDIWDQTNELHRPTLTYDLTDLVWYKKINGEAVTDKVAREALRKTPLTQSAVFADAVSRWIIGRETGELPNAGIHVGLSLGRLVACVTSGAIDVRDAIPLVKARGDAFNLVPGWLVAFDDVDSKFTDPFTREGSQKIGNSIVYHSMSNTQVQPVLGAKENARQDMQKWLDDSNLEDRIDYYWVSVSGPFHTPDLEPARGPFGEVLAEARRKNKITEPTRGILFGNNGQILDTPDKIGHDLLNQTTETENFLGMVKELYRRGVSRMFCLSAKPTEANMIGKIGKSEDIKREGVRENVDHTFPDDENPLFIAYRLRVVGQAA